MSSDSITAPIKSLSGGGNFFENLFSDVANIATQAVTVGNMGYRDWETDRKSTRLNSSHSAKSRMPSSA